ncbi:hypothetical protein [Nocardioides convexus]|uniref:hypothetical protein n=1 Tax=Nocardioides convexus TaxID=2712224 RepID=UPI0024181D28|nr:hypothetical protein [Nocardioides convexus]
MRLQGLRDADQVQAAGVLAAALAQRDVLALGACQHHAVAAAVAALDDRVHQVALLAADVDLTARRGLQAVGRVRHLGVHLAEDHVHPVVEQALPGLLQQDPADGTDHHRGQHHGADHHARLDRPAPEGQRSSYRGGDAGPQARAARYAEPAL